MAPCRCCRLRGIEWPFGCCEMVDIEHPSDLSISPHQARPAAPAPTVDDRRVPGVLIVSTHTYLHTPEPFCLLPKNLGELTRSSDVVAESSAESAADTRKVLYASPSAPALPNANPPRNRQPASATSPMGLHTRA